MSVTIPGRLLLGPGPSPVPPEILAALARPTIGHLDPVFLKIMDGVQDKLRKVFRTANPVTLAMSGTGSAGMETVMANLLESGDRALICVNGVFGTRMTDVAERCGAEVVRLDAPWGTVFDLEAVVEKARECRPKLVGIVHAETSTGAHQPLEGLGAALHDLGCLLVVDCVTSLGGAPVDIDAWGVDAAYSGTQKCLSCPPGLSPVTFSPRAVEILKVRKAKVQSWYLDLNLILNYWGGSRAYHHTAPINMLYGLDAALDLVIDEGLEARFERHRQAHRQLREGLDALGIRYVSQEGHHLPMLNAVSIPEGTDDAAVRRRLLEDHGIEIGAGLGVFAGKAWRIGLMGHGARAANVDRVLNALKQIL